MSVRLYETLGLKSSASQEDIKKAYRTLSKQCHPDHFPDDSDKTEEFRTITDAYDILSDPVKRKEYDDLGFIKKKGEDLEERAESEFISLFRQVFTSVPIHMLDAADFKKIMLESIDETKRQQKEGISKAEVDILKFRKVLKKTRTKNKKNLIKEYVTKEIKGANIMIETKKENIAVLDLVYSLVKEYDFDLQEFVQIGPGEPTNDAS